jgi:LPS-assembly lipoprotein
MSLSDRRRVLLLAAAVAGLGACGFTPAYGPGGGAQALQGQVRLPDPLGRVAFLLNGRLEDRLGRAGEGARYALDLNLATQEDGLGTTADGRTTRFNLLGDLRYVLTDTATGQEIAAGAVSEFTGYSTTGSTVATRAAERDAEDRLATLLADAVVDRITAAASVAP